MRRLAIIVLLLAGAAQAAVLDDFRRAQPWQASGSEGVRAELKRGPGGSLCLHADFGGTSGYAVMRRTLPLQWPANFDFVVNGQGGGAVNDLQLKFVDASGQNVWWARRTGLQLPSPWRLRPRHLSFAWGPAAERSLRETQAMEVVIAAGRDGGASHVCLSEISLVARAPEPAQWPQPVVRMRALGRSADVDLRAEREFNGLLLRWPAGRRGLDYTVQAQDAARGPWRTLRRVRGSDGGDDALFLPETTARRLRIRGVAAQPAVQLRDAAQWPDLNAVLSESAAALPRGDLPRAFVGEQNHWALVGVDGGGPRSALIDDDGTIELGRGGPSLAPSVRLDDGTRVTWAEVQATQSLRDRSLPVPTVQWRHPALSLSVTAAADGPASAPRLLAQYRLRNEGAVQRRFTLQLSLRPWQVNPPQQFLTTPGGASPVRSLAWRDGVLAVAGRGSVRPVPAPQAVRALGLDGGLSLAALAAARRLARLDDPQSHASAALQWQFELEPGASAEVALTASLAPATALPAADLATIGQAVDAVAARWAARLHRVKLQVPPGLQPVADTLPTALAHLLTSRDGAMLRPGTRSYARTWIRDGAMMTAALLRLGETAAAREFVDAFAPHVHASGQVPCCVDAHGADPVAEHDSQGEFVYAVAEVWRHGGGRGWLQRHWPAVQRVVARLEAMRQSQRGSGTPAHLFGLLPPSISHEGYFDRPAYSLWDDLWALRGYKDAVVIARALGAEAEAARWQAARAEFEREMAAAVTASARLHGIPYVPGAADRGDFDATSTSIALDPAQAQDVLPPALLAATFDEYVTQSRLRAEGRRTWRDYTPYEWRNVGALLRMGRAEEALALLPFFMDHRRPAGWNQWAEVVVPGEREVRFLGDMPHAWVSSDFIRSALDLFAYTREDPAQIVIGAGVTAPPVAVQGLRTPWGPLDWSLHAAASGWRLELARAGAEVRLAWARPGTPPRAFHEGRELTWQGRELPLPPAPATVMLQVATATR